MKSFERKARRALKHYVKAIWRQNQPPVAVMPQPEAGKMNNHLVVAPLDDDLGIYALGVAGEDQPFEYGFVLPGAVMEPPCFIPVESCTPQVSDVARTGA